jgi:hypothetical protein
MPDIYDVIVKTILIVLSAIVIVTITSAHKSKDAYRYYGAYSAGCFVLAGWIAYWIYHINN